MKHNRKRLTSRVSQPNRANVRKKGKNGTGQKYRSVNQWITLRERNKGTRWLIEKRERLWPLQSIDQLNEKSRVKIIMYRIKFYDYADDKIVVKNYNGRIARAHVNTLKKTH